ncbi:MAG: phosphoribosylglycinamide formyltransferase [Planctomycetes bacterium]|nr:phosphoribosylglycinamide formyltransferase [Planctomycetota bacterium]
MRNENRTLRLAVLFSGTGRTLENLQEKIARGEIPARIVLALASGSECGGIARARRLGLPLEIVDRRAHPDRKRFDERILRALEAHPADLVCLAGWLYLFPLPAEWRGRVLNIHPALLPRHGGRGFHGERVHRAVLEAGEKESGCTVHLADDRYDHGPTVLQRRVPVLPGDTPDTLGTRVFAEECIAYPEAVRAFAAGTIPGQALPPVRP